MSETVDKSTVPPTKAPAPGQLSGSCSEADCSMHKRIVSLSAVQELITEDALKTLEANVLNAMLCDEWKELSVTVATSHGVGKEEAHTAIHWHPRVIEEIKRFKQVIYVQKLVYFEAVWKNKKPKTIKEVLLATPYSRHQLTKIAQKIDNLLPSSCAFADSWYDLGFGQMWFFNNLLAEERFQVHVFGFVPGALLERPEGVSVTMIADKLKKTVGQQTVETLRDLVSKY